MKRLLFAAALAALVAASGGCVVYRGWGGEYAWGPGYYGHHGAIVTPNPYHYRAVNRGWYGGHHR